MPLGAGYEVGRSSVFMTFQGEEHSGRGLRGQLDTFQAPCPYMFDCGIHPAYSGLAALPFVDEIDLSTVDILLVTHFHLDHAASLPYVTEKSAFKGKVYMTHEQE
ncbi:cleavage and polyadenylation specifity factor protein [Klebsormidium nitens]|uniref:Cleavage and polyadenylation specifity factor protein n=1 Tax=Klebsormidium nitens TaxID=105231 RepID=A0A1Y1IPM3_KLENI|nr:cleavage and polyadenylation specifity factor protein [Klebsormidium nitens]|eukprot:GAQ91429.1 cleavage and polyadenylation specifity factor protein [Klebsormidium nitens]